MQKVRVLVVLVAALALAGCSATEQAEVAAPTVTVTATPEPAGEPAPEPLVASTPEPTASGSDDEFVTEVRIRLKYLPDATDEQLIASAHQACDKMAAGEDKGQVRLVEGEQPVGFYEVYPDSLAIATWAAKVYCPEFDS